MNDTAKPGLVALRDRTEIARAQEAFSRRMLERTDQSGEVELGFQGGRRPSTVHWRADLDLWMTFQTLESRYWTAFGHGNPFETRTPSITVEINSPLEGIDRRVAAVFARGDDARLHLMHRGKVGGGREGIGKQGFLDHIAADRLVSLEDGDRVSKVILIGTIDAPDFPIRVADFVRDVEQFKGSDRDTISVWWVNQGKTYAAERAGGYMWAPQKAKSGITFGHHENVSRVQRGDVVVHYANGSIVALGLVTAGGEPASKPRDLQDEEWGDQGWLARVASHELKQPIALNEIPVELRAEHRGGPFDRDGAVKQGYLFPLDTDIVTEIRQEFADRWPEGSPWFGTAGEGRALHILLKWKKSPEVSTIDRHKEIADQLGSVWWGKFGEAKVSTAKLDRLRKQVADGVRTYAFLYRQGEVWRTYLRDATADSNKVPDDRKPSYYSKENCSAFFEISDFTPLPATWPSDHLVLASKPDEPERLPGALSNQATPLFVYERTAEAVLPLSVRKVTEPLDMDWLVEKTLWPREVLEELCRDIRTTSPQVVLAGPPGTSKTWVAKHIARYLTQDLPLATRVVQFHPSYGYEEFIEGLRPVVDERNTLHFEVVPGIVVRMVNDMEDENQIHVIVIDEMNRANLPRVFGELMHLFEYRDEDEAIDLQYSKNFFLPKNLKFIGTMNTADRSIRSIDIALRRRFEVFECPPDRTILERFYEEGRGTNHIASLYAGFEALNEQLAKELDRHHTIGHTFFMAKELTPQWLRKIWDRKIGPLIEEYFFDQPDVVAKFSPEGLWPELKAS
jgi:hypothetical protein